MSSVILVYEPDASCLDPLDRAQIPRRHADVIDGDVIVIWREVIGDPDRDGRQRTHLWGQGIFANVTIDEARAALSEFGLEDTP